MIDFFENICILYNERYFFFWIESLFFLILWFEFRCGSFFCFLRVSLLVIVVLIYNCREEGVIDFLFR